MENNILQKKAEREVLADRFTPRVLLVGGMLATSLVLLSAEADSTAWLFISKGAGIFLFWFAALIDIKKPTNKK